MSAPSYPAAGPVPAPRVLVGLLAEFEDVDGVVSAAKRVRDAGFQRWDVHSPFPIHGIDRAMGIRATVLPWLVLGGGVAGVSAGLLVAWYANAFDYPLYVSGKPLMSLPAFIPVIFELGVLLAALTAVFGMLGLNRLPMLHNPLFRSERFRRVTNDRFFIVIEATDPLFDEPAVAEMLLSAGAVHVERIETEED